MNSKDKRYFSLRPMAIHSQQATTQENNQPYCHLPSAIWHLAEFRHHLDKFTLADVLHTQPISMISVSIFTQVVGHSPGRIY
jgi:hypothetical protein